MYQAKNENTFNYLPTGLSTLDQFLHGGVQAGSITEVTKKHQD
jgi:hypothetical protein